MNEEIKYLSKSFKTREDQWKEAAEWPHREFEEEWFASLFEDVMKKMKEANESLEGLTNHYFLKGLIKNLKKMEEEIEKNKLAAKTLLNSVKEVTSDGFFDFTYKQKNE